MYDVDFEWQGAVNNWNTNRELYYYNFCVYNIMKNYLFLVFVDYQSMKINWF